MNGRHTFELENLQLSIRSMTLDDLPSVVEIDRLSFSLPWPAASYRFELTQNAASHCWVVETVESSGMGNGSSGLMADVDNLSTQVVAMLVLWLVEDEAHIATIAVHPNFRGHGIGRFILLEALRDAGVHGATMATLEVRQNNRIAIDLYRQLGFEVVGRRFHYYHDTHEDALIMTLNSLAGLDSL